MKMRESVNFGPQALLPKLAAALFAVIAGYLLIQIALTGSSRAFYGIIWLMAALISLHSPGLLITHIYPFLASYSNVPIPFGSLVFSMERAILLLVLAGMLAHLAIRGIRWPAIPRRFTLASLALLLGCLPSLLAYPTSDSMAGYWSLIQKVLFVVIVLVFVDSESQLRTATRAMIFSFLVASIAGFGVVIATGDLGAVRFKAASGSGEQILLSLSGALDLAIIAGIFCLAEIETAKSKRARTLWSIIAVILFVGSTLTIRRQLLLGIGLVCLQIMFDKKGLSKPIRKSFLILCLIFGLGFILSSQVWVQRLNEPINWEDDSRLVLMRIGLSAWQESPLIGTGPWSFRMAASRASRSFASDKALYDQDTVFSSHNSFLTFLVESGVVGLAGAVFF